MLSRISFLSSFIRSFSSAATFVCSAMCRCVCVCVLLRGKSQTIKIVFANSFEQRGAFAVNNQANSANKKLPSKKAVATSQVEKCEFNVRHEQKTRKGDDLTTKKNDSEISKSVATATAEGELLCNLCARNVLSPRNHDKSHKSH